MSIPQRSHYLLLVIWLSALAGCSGDKRQALNGHVSLDGEPVEFDVKRGVVREIRVLSRQFVRDP